MSHSTYYRAFRRQFYKSDDPTNSVIALKDNGELTRSRANPIMLSSRWRKGCNQKSLLYIYSTIRHSDDRELNQARSKPDIVDVPARTASTTVHYYDSTQYCSTETVLLIVPFLQTNITSQMWPSGSKEVGRDTCIFRGATANNGILTLTWN